MYLSGKKAIRPAPGAIGLKAIAKKCHFKGGYNGHKNELSVYNETKK